MRKTYLKARAGALAPVLVLVLAGCQMPAVGDWLPGSGGSRAPAAATTAPQPETANDAVPTAGAAEAACVAQGRSQGLDVQSVVGSRVQRGADDAPVARDVMLRVARGAQVFDLRCNYQYASQEARIMSL